MAIIETKADQLLELVDKKKIITTKEAALELVVTDQYVRKLAIVLQKSNLIELKASAFTLTMLTVQKNEGE